MELTGSTEDNIEPVGNFLNLPSGRRLLARGIHLAIVGGRGGIDVGTIATVYAITNLVDPDELELVGEGTTVAAVIGITKVAALAYLMFNLYTPPCFAALGAMNSEMKSAKWLWGAIALQLATGFTVGFLVYQIGTLITTGSLGAGFAGGLIAVIAFALVISGIIVSNRRKLVAEYQLKTN